MARRIRWGRSCRIRGDCMTCTGTCGNGVRTGGQAAYPVGLQLTRRDLRSRCRPGARAACFAAAVGATGKTGPIPGNAGRACRGYYHFTGDRHYDIGFRAVLAPGQ